MQWEDRVGRRLKLRDLHTLQVVSEIGSMAKASQDFVLNKIQNIHGVKQTDTHLVFEK